MTAEDNRAAGQQPAPQGLRGRAAGRGAVGVLKHPAGAAEQQRERHLEEDGASTPGRCAPLLAPLRPRKGRHSIGPYYTRLSLSTIPHCP